MPGWLSNCLSFVVPFMASPQLILQKRYNFAVYLIGPLQMDKMAGVWNHNFFKAPAEIRIHPLECGHPPGPVAGAMKCERLNRNSSVGDLFEPRVPGRIAAAGIERMTVAIERRS